MEPCTLQRVCSSSPPASPERILTMATSVLNRAKKRPILIAGCIAACSLLVLVFAYVQVASLESVPTAQLIGRIRDFEKFPRLTKDSEAGINSLAKAHVGAARVKEEKGWKGRANAILGDAAALAGPKLHLGNLHQDLTEDHLWEICCSFGEVAHIVLHRDEAGESERFSSVTYYDEESANTCVEKLDGMEVAGKTVAVSFYKAKHHSHHWKPTDDQDQGGMKRGIRKRAVNMARLGGELSIRGASTVAPAPSHTGLTSSPVATATASARENFEGGEWREAIASHL